MNYTPPSYEEIKNSRYFNPEYLHKCIVNYAKEVAKKKKMPVWAVISDIILSGSTYASVIAEQYKELSWK